MLDATETVMDRVTAPLEGTDRPVFTDGFGSRFLGFDAEAGDPIEILSFDPALVAAPDFASAVGVRVARLAGARHALFARVRRMDRPAPDSLLLVSDRVAGWRVADVLDISNRVRLKLDMSAVLNLLRQLIPAVALFGRHQRDLSVGNIAPERLLLTPQGRLVLAEYVLGDAIERLALSRDDLWRRFRVPVVSSDANRDAARSDVLAIGLVALSLLLGRRLREDEFPFALGDLLELVTESHGGDARPLSPAFASWLGRTLQLEGHKALQSPKDAQVAFEELLATERGYVTSPAMLERFIEQFENIAGPPTELLKPVALSEPAPPVVEPTPPLVAEPVQSEPRPPDPETSWAPRPPEPAWEPPAFAAQPASIAPPEGEPHVEDEPYQAAPLLSEPQPPEPLESSPDSLLGVSEPRSYEPEPLAERAAVPSSVSGRVAAREEAGAETPVLNPPVSQESQPWMTKALAGLTVLVMLEAAVIFWLWNRSAAALVRDGELTVQSRPAAARVTLDDDDLGVTPLSVRRAPGTYTLKVQVGNGEPRVIVVQIRAGVQTAQYLELQGGR